MNDLQADSYIYDICSPDADKLTAVKDVYQAYVKWCINHDGGAVDERRFARIIKLSGIPIEIVDGGLSMRISLPRSSS